MKKTTSTPPIQSGLFDSVDLQSLADTHTKLQAQVDRLKKDNRSWERSYKRLKEERDQLYQTRLSDDNHPLYEECKRLRLEVNALRDSLRDQVWRELGMSSRGSVSREALTRLLRLCHPDRWSQGQPATELAHEITVQLNQLRERGEVQR
jgi:hypothetical protein